MKGKKLVSGVLGLAMMTTALAGCGTAKKDDTKKGGKVTLEFPCIWVGQDSKAAGFKKMVDGFNKKYDGKYEVKIVEYTDYDLYADYIRTQITSGDAPDLFSVKTQADVELYSQSGKVLDLTDYLKSDDMKAKYDDSVIKGAQVDGKSYALPWEAAIIPVIWNGTLLEKAGIKDLPKTEDEFVETLEALKKSGVKTPCSFMTKNNAWTAMLWYSYALGSKGGSSAITGKWDTKKYEEATEWLKKLYSYAPSDALGADAQVVNGHFFNNETAVYTNGTWILGNMKQNAAKGVYDNIKFSAGPGNTIIQYTQAYVLSGAVKDKAKQEGVKAFMSYITDADRLTELSNSSGSVFVPKMNVVDDKYVNEIVKLRDKAKVITPSFESAVSTDAAANFSPYLEKLLSGDLSTKDFVSQLQKDNKK